MQKRNRGGSGLRLLHNALACADTVLIPVQAAYLPVKGLQQLIRTMCDAHLASKYAEAYLKKLEKEYSL